MTGFTTTTGHDKLPGDAKYYLRSPYTKGQQLTQWAKDNNNREVKKEVLGQVYLILARAMEAISFIHHDLPWNSSLSLSIFDFLLKSKQKKPVTPEGTPVSRSVS